MPPTLSPMLSQRLCFSMTAIPMLSRIRYAMQRRKTNKILDDLSNATLPRTISLSLSLSLSQPDGQTHHRNRGRAQPRGLHLERSDGSARVDGTGGCGGG